MPQPVVEPLTWVRLPSRDPVMTIDGLRLRQVTPRIDLDTHGGERRSLVGLLLLIEHPRTVSVRRQDCPRVAKAATRSPHMES